MRVLLAEDSLRLQHSLKKALVRANYAVDLADDGETALWLAENNEYDAIVLDIMLPKRDGLSVLRALRTQGKKTHILLLTAKDTIDDRVAGLEQGADDYLVKPFALRELMARIQVLCRRAYGHKSDHLKVADLEVDITARRVFRAGQSIELTARDYALLEYLIMRRGQIVTRTEIEAHLYNEESDPMSNAVDAAVYTLRKKISQFGDLPLIHTKRGQGYVLDEVPI